MAPYCWDCERWFASDKALDQHYQDSPVHKVFECVKCGEECVGTAELTEHMKFYHPPPYCRQCDREFNSEQALEAHLRESSVHKLFVCVECGEECVGTAELEEHMNEYHPPPYCRQCDREFNSEQALEQHFRESSAHKVFACKQCGQACVGPAGLDVHMIASHPPAICQQCSREFPSLKALIQHLTESSLHKVFACPECGEQCFGKAALDDHMDRVHPYSCQQCDRHFNSEHALRQHLKDSPVHRPPAFLCTDCNREFASQAALTQHLKSPIHIHRCEECNREFASAGSLQQHRTSPAHVHKCEWCEETFPSRGSLDEHLQTTCNPNGFPALAPTALPVWDSEDSFGSEDGSRPLPPPRESSTATFWDDIPTHTFQIEPAPVSQASSEVELSAREASIPNETTAASDFGASDPLSAVLPTLLPRVRDPQAGEPDGVRRGESSSSGDSSLSRSTNTTEGTIPFSGFAIVVPLTADRDGQETQSPQEDVKVAGPSAQEEHDSSLVEGATCCICFDKPKSAALVPCGHRLCFECGDVIHKRRGDCPICNTGIAMVLRLFG